MEATEQYIHVVLFILLYNTVPTFSDHNPNMDLSNESYLGILFPHGVVVDFLLLVVCLNCLPLMCAHSNKGYSKVIPVMSGLLFT